MSAGDAPQVALKVDVDTYVGMRDGVPALMRALDARGLRASFFISMGPDHSGRALRRLLKPGFLAKMLRTRAPSMYGWRTILYGTLLPGPQIARSFPQYFETLRAGGHEVGVHGYDHVYWHDRLAGLDDGAVRAELGRGLNTFAEITGRAAESFAAPGWQCTAASLAAIDAAGLRYHSCTRGRVPYRPVLAGGPCRAPEIPTTWLTLDEILGVEGTEAATLIDYYVSQLRPGLNVHTIHTEVEGMSMLPMFEKLLDALRPRAEFVRLIDVAAALDTASLPLGRVEPGTVPGRAGAVAVQTAAE